MYRILHNLISTTKLSKKLVRKKQFKINHASHLKIPRNKTMRNAFESISYHKPKIWEILPSEM